MYTDNTQAAIVQAITNTWLPKRAVSQTYSMTSETSTIRYPQASAASFSMHTIRVLTFSPNSISYSSTTTRSTRRASEHGTV
jgi:hypothetical protein